MLQKMKCFILFIPLFLSCFSCHDKEVDIEPVAPIEPELDVFIAAQPVALLDLTTRNGEQEEADRHLYSADYMLELSGVSYFTTDDLERATTESDIILFSSPVNGKTFSEEELDMLANWVGTGGVLVAPAVTEITERLTTLFGISSVLQGRERYALVWEGNNEAELTYLDEPEERTVSLGNPRYNAVKSFGYSTATADILARFDGTREAAVVRNAVGEGFVYSVGILWRDVIQRSQLNKDFEAQRAYSNAFEPSADVYALFFRAVCAKYRPVSVWKFTIPGGYQSVLIPTHDCDSRTAYDAMHYLSDYEQKLGLHAHYFLTVHYFRNEGYMSQFYDDASIAKARKLVQAGHTVGSHSIGHFPDFSKTERFPLIVVTEDEYRPTYDVDSKTTTGGSTWAEIVLSKQILERDLGNTVRSFRSGHLCMNKNIPEACRQGSYSFGSSYGAGDVLSEFPFKERIGNDWAGGESGVLQMPLHISDVISSDPVDDDNWQHHPGKYWLPVLNKLAGNYAPCILLVHPNREWKMSMQKSLIEQMDKSRIGLWNFEAYGDFWLQRCTLDFDYCYIAEKRKVIIRVSNIGQVNGIPFAIDVHDKAEVDEVVLTDEDQQAIRLSFKQIAPGRYLAIQPN